MSNIDLIILAIYLLAMLGVGFYFHRKHQSQSDFFLGGRKLGAWHLGLSVVATDVGGGFSIGLGGLGFVLGLSGSWMLFTGFIGAWLSAGVLIPRICRHPAYGKWLTLPQWYGSRFGPRAALLAALISAIGYLAFTSAQLLAGAKLVGGVFPTIDRHYALLIMGLVAVLYTSMGGLKAVVYTDTLQWIILLLGLGGIALPLAWVQLGGWEAIAQAVPATMFRLDQLKPVQLLNWAVTIIPIWFVGMTLFQRLLAAGDEKTAVKAWRIAAWFEWPIMAFMGVALGLLARVAAEQGVFAALTTAVDPEQALPILLAHTLPVGLMGLVLAAYFSAILSTADSCLMAASANFHLDILGKRWPQLLKNTKWSQWLTLVTGLLAVWLATAQSDVLGLMLGAYAFLVSGLLVPLLFGLYSRRGKQAAAVYSMLLGGGTTLFFQLGPVALPFALDANIGGLTVSFVTYLLFSFNRTS